MNIGKPDELFYWGPSRAKPLYMSDFMAAAETFFIHLARDTEMPSPPKTLVLFHEDKMVWLSNAQDFSDFTEAMFNIYAEQDRYQKDYRAWRAAVKKFAHADASELVEAWSHTLFAEFSLYGAATAINKQLHRLDSKQRQQIWGAFTLPVKDTFMNAIDKELYITGDPQKLAEKYPWIDDGYSGVHDTSLTYFTKRLKLVQETPPLEVPRPNLEVLIKEYNLSKEEVAHLTLARDLAEFIDDRKAWMMQTRRNIHSPAININYGWCFENGKAQTMTIQSVKEFWERYVNFKAYSSTVSGLVASNGGHHFLNGEIRVVTSPTDNVEDNMILVVPSTSPSYVPLMRKARALITDHGGIMSHAAIVGREFGLPCIVGTKHGTKVLKDGDKVVLDLVKGDVSR